MDKIRSVVWGKRERIHKRTYNQLYCSKTKTDKQIENTIQTVRIIGEENLELIGEHISGQ